MRLQSILTPVSAPTAEKWFGSTRDANVHEHHATVRENWKSSFERRRRLRARIRARRRSQERRGVHDNLRLPALAQANATPQT